MTRLAALSALALSGALLAAAPVAASAAPAAPAAPARTASATSPAAAHANRAVNSKPRCARSARVAKRTVRRQVRWVCVPLPRRATTATAAATALAAPNGTTTSASSQATTATTATTAAVLSPFEARLVTLVNQARTSNGLSALRATAGTTDVARRWSLQLARAGELSHNPNLVDNLAAAGSSDWHLLAENVGTGPADDPDRLFAAYMASPHHRENILDPRAVFIGMGAVMVTTPDGPTVWNTMNFTDSYSTGYGAPRTQAVASVLPLDAAAAALGLA